jgi:hypothetical protein
VNPQEQSGNCEGSEVRNAPQVKKKNKTKNLKKKKKKKRMLYPYWSLWKADRGFWGRVKYINGLHIGKLGWGEESMS